MPKKLLSIYFGVQDIYIVETQGKNTINQLTIPLVSGQDKDLTAAYPQIPLEEVQIAALIQEALRKSHIEATDAVLSLALSSLLIRFFEMPNLPHRELYNAVSFEAKKYMPFRLEDLVFDFHYRVHEKNRKVLQIIFVAAKRETVDSIISILSQCGLKAVSIEPGTLSTLRALRSFKQIEPKLSFAFVEVAEQELNFSIVDKSFIVFSHEIKLEGQPEDLFLKLVNEIRIALDYSRRHFSAKDIEKIILFSEGPFLDQVDSLSKEIGITTTGIDFKNTDMAKVFSSIGVVKAFGASLVSVLPYPFGVNIVKKRPIVKKQLKEEAAVSVSIFSVRKLRQSIIIGFTIVVLSYLLCLPIQISVKERLKQIKAEVQSNVEAKFSSLIDLEEMNSNYARRLAAIKDVVMGRRYITPKLNSLAKALPSGLWLSRLSIKEEQGKLKLFLSGYLYLEDEQKGFSVVDDFVNKLKSDRDFSQYFEQLNLVSVKKDKVGKVTVTNFEISSK